MSGRHQRGGIPPGVALAMAAPLFLLLLVAFLWPLARFLSVGLLDPGLTLEHFARFANTPLYIDVLVKTVVISLAVTVCALILGYPIAVLMVRVRGVVALAIAACVLLPLWTPVLVRTYSWIILLQRRGIVNDALLSVGLIEHRLSMLYSFGAVVVAMTHVMMPFMILPIQSSLRGIPRDLPQAAVGLGATRLQAFLAITWPLSLPGVMAGCLMVFIISLGFYITPALLGGPRVLMVSTLITQQAFELLNWPFAAALSMILMAITLGIASVFRRILNIDRIAFHA